MMVMMMLVHLNSWCSGVCTAVGIHGPGLWWFSSMKCVLMTNFKVYVWVWHMIDESTGSWWWGKSDILFKVWSSNCFGICLQTHKSWSITQKIHKMHHTKKFTKMHAPYSQFCWQQFWWDFKNQIMDYSFVMGGSEQINILKFLFSTWLLCTQVFVFDMIVFTLVYEMFSP